MDESLWASIDDYVVDHLISADPSLDEALASNAKAGLPAIDVSPAQGKLLHLIVQMTGARRVLEIGTLGGYSTIWMARALPEGGTVVTLEASPKHASVARSNIERAGLLGRVDIRVGPALETLSTLAEGELFDLVFIDADKENNPGYLSWALRLSHPGTVIIIDNVVRQGRLVDAATTDAGVWGTQKTFEMLKDEPRVSATAIQTVGAKGWDGFIIARVG